MALMLFIPALVLSGSACPKPRYVLTPPATQLNSGRRARPNVPVWVAKTQSKTIPKQPLCNPYSQNMHLTTYD